MKLKHSHSWGANIVNDPLKPVIQPITPFNHLFSPGRLNGLQPFGEPKTAGRWKPCWLLWETVPSIAAFFPQELQSQCGISGITC